MREPLLDKLDRKIGRFALKNLMTILAVGTILVWIVNYIVFLRTGVWIEVYIDFNKEAILRGQVWRLVTFLFISPEFNPFLLDNRHVAGKDVGCVQIQRILFLRSALFYRFGVYYGLRDGVLSQPFLVFGVCYPVSQSPSFAVFLYPDKDEMAGYFRRCVFGVAGYFQYVARQNCHLRGAGQRRVVFHGQRYPRNRGVA